MSDMAWLEPLIGHNTWATRVLLNDSRELSTARFHERFDIGPGSLHDVLRHIVAAMLRWADRIEKKPLRDSLDKGEALTPEQLLEHLSRADGDLRGASERISAGGLWDEPIEFPDGGMVFRFSRRSSILHVLTHGMYHRAQAVNIRRRLGMPALELDLDVIEHECIRTGQMKEA